MYNNEIEGSIVIVKFFKNLSEKNIMNPLITRTLKKVGVIERNVEIDPETTPKDGELWRVRITKEICEKQSKGCFILHPIQLVIPKTVVKLVPGMYEEEEDHKILFIYPHNAEHNCILPLDLKRKLNYRAVLVKLKEVEEENKEIKSV